MTALLLKWPLFRLLCLLVLGVSVISPTLCALTIDQVASLQDAIDQRNYQIELLRVTQGGLQMRIEAAEASLDALEKAGAQGDFEARNTAIGTRYDIRQWREQIKSLQIEVNRLQRSNMLDMEIMQNSALPDAGQGLLANTPENLAIINQHGGAMPVTDADRESIRLQQQQLVKESYDLPSGQAALKLAQARALEPMEQKPLLGETSVLLSVRDGEQSKRFIGLMQHMGGNQYYLEATLKPGRQEFLIGGYRFPGVVPDDYAGVTCIILLDMHAKEPALVYFSQ